MFEFVRRLGRFLNAMDAKAITSLGVSLALLVFVVLMFIYGQNWLNLDDGLINELLNRAAESPWAVVGVISVYVLLALTGFPQILLITATVITFGPVHGVIFAWIGTMFSASFTFMLGHLLGGGWVRRFGGERVERTIAFIGRHGVLASGLVRVVPSAPFIVVNAAAGSAHIPMWKFWLGTGVGIIPKILLVATLGALAPDQSVLRDGIGGVVEFFTSREPQQLLLVALVISLWLALLLGARMAYLGLRRRDSAN